MLWLCSDEKLRLFFDAFPRCQSSCSLPPTCNGRASVRCHCAYSPESSPPIDTPCARARGAAELLRVQDRTAVAGQREVCPPPCMAARCGRARIAAGSKEAGAGSRALPERQLRKASCPRSRLHLIAILPFLSTCLHHSLHTLLSHSPPRISPILSPNLYSFRFSLSPVLPVAPSHPSSLPLPSNLTFTRSLIPAAFSHSLFFSPRYWASRFSVHVQRFVR
jgi:hypothetical protein